MTTPERIRMGVIRLLELIVAGLRQGKVAAVLAIAEESLDQAKASEAAGQASPGTLADVAEAIVKVPGCPICGGRESAREGRLNGESVCVAGHRYPTSDSVLVPEKL